MNSVGGLTFSLLCLSGVIVDLGYKLFLFVCGF